MHKHLTWLKAVILRLISQYSRAGGAISYFGNISCLVQMSGLPENKVEKKKFGS